MNLRTPVGLVLGLCLATVSAVETIATERLVLAELTFPGTTETLTLETDGNLDAPEVIFAGTRYPVLVFNTAGISTRIGRSLLLGFGWLSTSPKISLHTDTLDIDEVAEVRYPFLQRQKKTIEVYFRFRSVVSERIFREILFPLTIEQLSSIDRFTYRTKLRVPSEVDLPFLTRFLELKMDRDYQMSETEPETLALATYTLEVSCDPAATAKAQVGALSLRQTIGPWSQDPDPLMGAQSAWTVHTASTHRYFPEFQGSLQVESAVRRSDLEGKQGTLRLRSWMNPGQPYYLSLQLDLSTGEGKVALIQDVGPATVVPESIELTTQCRIDVSLNGN